MKLLFVNACVREKSRTLDLAVHLLSLLEKRFSAADGLEVEELNLRELGLHGHSRESLAEREKLLLRRQFHHPMFQYANQFATADVIVIAAPYWDLSFPAVLKTYIENICVSGITFDYEEAAPLGLCRAKKLYYVTTAGGPVFCDFGFSYLDALCKNFFGIQDTCCFMAERLDMMETDKVAEELRRVKEEMSCLVSGT